MIAQLVLLRLGRPAMKNALSPKELGQAIGVSESSLKRWADAGQLQVARTAGGHRRIHLTEAIRFIRSSGFAVQRPDVLGLDDMSELDPTLTRNQVREQFYEALHSGRTREAQGLVLALYLDGLSIAQIVDQVVAPAMYRLGELWQHSVEGIFIEHRASDICNQALNRVRGLVRAREHRPVALGAAPGDDPYVLPSLMAACVLADEGWSEVNLGAQTPMSVLAKAALDCGARLVWLAMSTTRSYQRGKEICDALVDELYRNGVKADVVVGGPALRGEVRPPCPNVYLANSMAELAAFGRGLRTAGKSTSEVPAR